MSDIASVCKDLQVTNTFTTIYSDEETRIIIVRGGSGSSKTYSVCQMLMVRMMSEYGIKIGVFRKTRQSCKRTIYRTFKNDILGKMGIEHLFEHYKQDLEFKYGNNMIEFAGCDDPEKIKSSDYNYIILEEATDFTLEDFKEFARRPRSPRDPRSKNILTGKRCRNHIYLLFNPINAFHWIKKNLIDEGMFKNFKEYLFTHLDNPFLDEDTRQSLEDTKETDYNSYLIYCLGEWGSFDGTIYTNYDSVKTIPEKDCYFIYGLDFGYSNNKTALIKIWIPYKIIYDKDGKEERLENRKPTEVYEECLIYELGLTNQDLINLMHDKNISKDRPIYADCAEPARIKELQTAGFNVKPANKSVSDGIDNVKRVRTHISEWSPEILKEKNGYTWKKDRNGEPTGQPLKLNDHLMDAERYAIFTYGNTTHIRYRTL